MFVRVHDEAVMCCRYDTIASVMRALCNRYDRVRSRGRPVSVSCRLREQTRFTRLTHEPFALPCRLCISSNCVVYPQSPRGCLLGAFIIMPMIQISIILTYPDASYGHGETTGWHRNSRTDHTQRVILSPRRVYPAGLSSDRFIYVYISTSNRRP